MNSSLLLRVEEAAERLAISRTALYALLLRGDIRSIHIGRSRRITAAALDEFIAGKQEESASFTSESSD